MLDIIKLIINNFTFILIFFLILFFYLKKLRLIKFFIIIILTFIFFTPFPSLLVYNIEKLNHPININRINADIDKIVILSGFEQIRKTKKFDQLYLGGTNNRIIEGARVYMKYKKKIIFSGSSSTRDTKVIGTYVAKKFFDAFDINNDNIIFDTNSKNTEETFIFLNKNYKNKKHLIVTSALHMQRCKLLARKYKLNVLLYPVDFKVDDANISFFNISLDKNIYLFHYGLREIAALLFYKFTNKI